MCSVIRPTWRAFATAATAVKRRGNCGKTARKRNDAEAQNGASLGRWRAMRGASCGDPCTLPRGQKSFDPASADRMPPFTQKIFPTGKCGRGCCGGAAGLTRVLQGCSGAELGAAGVQRGWPGRRGDAAGLARVLHGCSEGYAGLCRAACCRLTLSPSGIGCSTGRPPGERPA